MNPADVDLEQASRTYGVANTPLFLVRKLQADPAIRAISEQCSGQEIVDGLCSLANVEPNNAVEAVRPYAYLVALWFKLEIQYLQEAASLQTPVHGWYAYIAQALIETFSPVHSAVIQVPGQLSAPAVSVGSTAATSRILIVP